MTHPSGRRPSSSRRCADRSGPCEWAVAAGWLGSCGAAAFESDGFESVDQPIRPDVPQYGRRDLFDGLVRGRQPGDALALHHGLGLVDLVAAVEYIGVFAAGAALVADGRE